MYDSPRIARPAPLAGAVAECTCTECSLSFPTAKALDQHKRIKHDVKRLWRTVVGPENRCPACHLIFSTHLRATAHLSDPRRNRKRRDLVISGAYLANSVEVQRQLDDADRAERRAAQQSGRSTRSQGAPKRAT